MRNIFNANVTWGRHMKSKGKKSYGGTGGVRKNSHHKTGVIHVKTHKRAHIDGSIVVKGHSRRTPLERTRQIVKEMQKKG